MRTIEQIFGAKKIVPTVNVEDISLVRPLCEALLNAGITVIAVRIVSQKSFDTLSYISSEIPEMTVGAAGIMAAAGFLNASLAGARFISSPGTTPELFTAARTRYNDAHFLPGVLLPSGIMDAATRGFEVMNLFPAEALNGYELLKSYAHTFPKIRFAVNGGVNLANMGKYLQLSNVVAVGLASIASSSLIAARDFAEIRARAEQAVAMANAVIAEIGSAELK